MKRYIKSVTEPSGVELGKFMDQRREELATKYSPFVVKDFLDIYFNSYGYKISLPTGDTWIAYKSLSPRGYKLYGAYVNPNINSPYALKDEDLATDRVFDRIDSIISYLWETEDIEA